MELGQTRTYDREKLWPFETELGTNLVIEWEGLEGEINAARARQREVVEELKADRLRQAMDVFREVDDYLTTLVRDLAAILRDAGLGWEGVLRVGCLRLEGRDWHGSYQAKGSCFTSIQAIGGLNWVKYDAVARKNSYHSLPDITAARVLELATKNGLIADAWDASLHMEDTVSFVIRKLENT